MIKDSYQNVQSRWSVSKTQTNDLPSAYSSVHNSSVETLLTRKRGTDLNSLMFHNCFLKRLGHWMSIS